MIELMLQAERALMVGMVDQAERLYLMASRNDPRNAIAVVGLARVALERNDDRAAYDLACDALAIDPDNAAALRLEARLSEVLQHRGETVERPAFVQPGGPGTGAADEASDARSKPDAPFPPGRKVPGAEAGEALGTVMRTERPGWQPARMPDAVRPAAVTSGEARPTAAEPKQPWAPPGRSIQDVPGPGASLPAAMAEASTAPALTAAAPAAATRGATPASIATTLGAGEPQAIRIRPTPGPSSGPTRYAAVTVPDEPVAAQTPMTLPGGVPASAIGPRPFAGTPSTDPAAAAEASEPPRRSFLRRLFGR